MLPVSLTFDKVRLQAPLTQTRARFASSSRPQLESTSLVTCTVHSLPVMRASFRLHANMGVRRANMDTLADTLRSFLG